MLFCVKFYNKIKINLLRFNESSTFSHYFSPSKVSFEARKKNLFSIYTMVAVLAAISLIFCNISALQYLFEYLMQKAHSFPVFPT